MSKMELAHIFVMAKRIIKENLTILFKLFKIDL
jgi:hypothetical protein